MRFYLNWYRNYAWSKLELQYLINKNQTSKFDHAFSMPVEIEVHTLPHFKAQKSMAKLDAKG